MNAKKRYVVGIDLGTSNTVVAFAAPGDEQVRLLEIDQLVGLGQLAPRPLLPSVRYHPAPGELDPGDLQLPWAAPVDAAPAVIGSLALDLGAQVPGRLVASAKSWLSHAGVDRTAPILPWGAGEDVAKISPVAASASYLAYVRHAWNWRFPDAPLEQQEIVLTVPASFDEGARALTVEAARLAGLPELRLLEEPQAAFYDWLFLHRGSLRSALEDTRLVLVCDVGGGTTDLTLIQVATAEDGPQLTRIGVGDHLMLGGDNMDLALAHLVESRLGSEARLSAAQLSQLIARCRSAKEQLLAAAAPETTKVTLLGSGGRVVGGARSVELGRDEVRAMLVEGFFPQVEPAARPERRRSGIVEFGLPYPADPAITRHVADFLGRHAAASGQALGEDAPDEGPLPVPDTLLLNGGVYRAEALSARLHDTLSQWRGEPLRVLRNDHPELAVARGAVAYALVRRGHGPKIGGGSPRSYFLVLDEDRETPRGICVLPRGSEEGQEMGLTDRTFTLRLGQPVRFHLVSSVADNAYRLGELTDLADDFVRLPPIATVLPAPEGSGPVELPVQLTTAMTEVGTLQMHCVGTENAAQRWLLEFQLRGAGSASPAPDSRLPPRFADAVEAIDRVFGTRSTQVEVKEVKQLRGRLEHLLGKRDDWDMVLLRALFDALWERARRRRRTAEHERVWLSLAGFCLRPGLGHALDEWRVGQVWALHGQGIQYVNESQNWSEWWTLWRRVAGGLPEEAQLRLLDDIAPYLQPDGTKKPARRLPAVKAGSDAMVRLAAALERISPRQKEAIGEGLLERLNKADEKAHSWWAMGRIGARAPLYGSAHNIVPAETAARWLERILALDWKTVDPAFAATQIARMTGDRSRDLPDELRSRVAHRLQAVGAAPAWIAMVRSVITLDEAEQRLAFGEALPPGLKLLGEDAGHGH